MQTTYCVFQKNRGQAIVPMETASQRYCGYGNCIANQCATLIYHFAELSEDHHATFWGLTNCNPVKHGL